MFAVVGFFGKSLGAPVVDNGVNCALTLVAVKTPQLDDDPSFFEAVEDFSPVRCSTQFLQLAEECQRGTPATGHRADA